MSNSNGLIESFISTVATRCENRFIRDPETGEKPMYSPDRRKATGEYIRYVLEFGATPPVNAVFNGVDMNTLSQRRRGQIHARLATVWLEFEPQFYSWKPRFITADWFRENMHNTLMYRETKKPRQTSKKYKMT